MADQLRNRLAEISCGQRVGIEVVIGIGLTRKKRSLPDDMANGSNSRECRRVRERNSPRVSGAQCASNAVSFVAVGGTDREFIVDIGVRDAFTAFLAPLHKAEWVVYS